MEIQQGQFNNIDESVQFIPFKNCKPGPVILGDCNTIHEGVRIMVGPDGFRMGDYNVIHHDCTLGGPGPFVMGHNCWFGQEAWLDSTGGLTLGNGVRVGVRANIWSHIGSGEQVEGWLCTFRPTVLEDDVWLVGDSHHIASGVTMAARSAAMAHAVITRDTLPDTVYAGVPARAVSFRLRQDISLQNKFALMWKWANDFADDDDKCFVSYLDGEDEPTTHFVITRKDGCLVIGLGMRQGASDDVTQFDLVTKTYTKKLTQLERDFYRFIYGNKARFLPV